MVSSVAEKLAERSGAPSQVMSTFSSLNPSASVARIDSKTCSSGICWGR